jgi:hypothetical protein
MNLGKDEPRQVHMGCGSDCLAICVHELREMFRSPRPLSWETRRVNWGSLVNLRDAYLFLSGRQAPDRVAYDLAGLKEGSWT